jgi:hypothetical protein
LTAFINRWRSSQPPPGCPGSLFTSAWPELWDRELVHVINGCISDSVQADGQLVRLYFPVPDKFCEGLPVLFCARGSSHVETVWSVLNDIPEGNNVGLELAHDLLLVSACKFNVNARQRRRGLPDVGHHQSWLMTELLRLRSEAALLTAAELRPFAPPPITTERFGADQLLALQRQVHAVASEPPAAASDTKDEFAWHVALRRRFFPLEQPPPPLPGPAPAVLAEAAACAGGAAVAMHGLTVPFVLPAPAPPAPLLLLTAPPAPPSTALLPPALRLSAPQVAPVRVLPAPPRVLHPLPPPLPPPHVLLPPAAAAAPAGVTGPRHAKCCGHLFRGHGKGDCPNWARRLPGFPRPGFGPWGHPKRKPKS